MASISFSCHSTDLFLLQGQKHVKQIRGLHFNPLATNKNNTFNWASIGLRKASWSSLRSVGGVRIAQKLREDADIIPAGDDVFVDNGEYDLDCPTGGLNSIAEAIEDIRQGKFVIVVDDEDRENEGDLIMAASLVKPKDMAFIVKHGTGIVCVGMKEDDLERLQLPLMVTQKENEEKLCTAFTVSVDAKVGTSTGVSAEDRAKTVVALASRDSKPVDFNRPGHIFPLKYREGGVLKRAGHTEASVDLAMLAGLDPAGVLCEIVDDDGSMARLPKLREFAKKENLKIISIADLIRYRRKRDKLVERSAHAPIPTTWGPFGSSGLEGCRWFYWQSKRRRGRDLERS
ncbi:hypothetical protein MRB53_001824 [Persea americana]|uniref:Uncharacterized protein n=1 Tax=Persea americana TaxID=3435 RepID=A0ACC2MTQ4_PERAE|nr:hypothetical protein MRB53_001824 [Persea americana]